MGRSESEAGGLLELGFVDLVIAAQEGDDGLGAGAVGKAALAHEGDAFDVLRGKDLEEVADVGDGTFAWGVDEFGGAVAGGGQVVNGGEPGGCAFEVGSVSGGGGGDEVFAGFGVDHELLRLRAAHGAGVGFDGEEVEAAAGEDAAVDGVVLFIGEVEASGVDIEGVGVLHEELADAQEAGFWAGLVAELGLDLIPDLGELLVAAELVAGNGGHDLFVSHGEAQVGALAVLEAEHVVAHAGPSSGLLPDLGGVDGGQEELLADGVHLLADDGDDLINGALAEREVRVNAGAELADVAGAQQQLVAGDLGVGGGFTKGGNEELGPAMHAVRRPRSAAIDDARASASDCL